MRRTPKCKLCKVKSKAIQTDTFFIVNCKKHFVPIVILNEHKKDISQELKKQIEKEVKEIYPHCSFNYKLNDSDEHWHVHLKGANVT